MRRGMSVVHILIITPFFEIPILYENILEHAGDYPFQKYFDGFIDIVVSYLAGRL